MSLKTYIHAYNNMCMYVCLFGCVSVCLCACGVYMVVNIHIYVWQTSMINIVFFFYLNKVDIGQVVITHHTRPVDDSKKIMCSSVLH